MAEDSKSAEAPKKTGIKQPDFIGGISAIAGQVYSKLGYVQTAVTVAEVTKDLVVAGSLSQTQLMENAGGMGKGFGADMIFSEYMSPG